MGLFVNTLPLRLAAEGSAAFAEMLLRVRTAVMEAEAHQQVPLERIVDALSLPRSLSRQPLFQTLYSHLPGRARAGLETFTRESGGQQFDFALETAERGDGSLDLAFGYALDLYRPETARRYADAFIALARAAVDAPASRLDGLPLVSPHALATYAAPGHGRTGWRMRRCMTSSAGRPATPPMLQPSFSVTKRCGSARWTRGRTVWPAPAGARRGRGDGRGGGPAARAGPDRGSAGRMEGRRRLRPLRPRSPHRTHRAHARGCRCPAGAGGEGMADGFQRIDPTLADLSGFPDTPPDLPTHPEQLAYVIFTSAPPAGPRA